MLDSVKDKCGVAAVYRMGKLPEPPRDASGRIDALRDPGNVTPYIPNILTYLQNRGQLAAGVTSYNPDRDQILDTYKDNGTVAEVFRTANSWRKDGLMRKYAGRAAIGHVRYATCGTDDPSSAQPFERHHGRKWKWFSFGFNGNIANYPECKSQILDRGDYHLVRDTDTEIILHHLSLALKGDHKPTFETLFQHIHETFDGAYSIVVLTADGDLIVARDPQGFRPLCYGVKGDLFAAASESLPLDELGFENIQNVEPGTLIHVTEDGYKVHRFAPARKAHCFFEWVYFSNAASVLEGRSVYLSRRDTGEELARLEHVEIADDCIVVPVPDTARAAADAFAQALKVPCFEGLMRNRYVGRTFIESQSRTEKARSKYTVIPDVLRGKRVFLVEDSIVRSTTLRVIISMLKEKGGAAEVHVRVACPPIVAPCSYGIDMSTVGELFAPRLVKETYRGPLPEEESKKLAEDLQADSLRYLPVDGLARGIGLPEEHLCMGCVTGTYPTSWGQKLYRFSLEESRREEADTSGEGSGRRSYQRLIRSGEGGGFDTDLEPSSRRPDDEDFDERLFHEEEE